MTESEYKANRSKNEPRSMFATIVAGMLAALLSWLSYILWSLIHYNNSIIWYAVLMSVSTIASIFLVIDGRKSTIEKYGEVVLSFFFGSPR